MAWWIKKQNLSEEQRQYILSIKNNLSHYDTPQKLDH